MKILRYLLVCLMALAAFSCTEEGVGRKQGDDEPIIIPPPPPPPPGNG